MTVTAGVRAMACRRRPWLARRGLGLPEVLAAMVVLGTGMSGLLAAHWQAADLQRDAWQRRHAVMLLSELALRMRLNPEADYRALLAQPLPASSREPGDCLLAPCAPAARASADIAALARQMRHRLTTPSWLLQACPDAPGDCLWLGWTSTPVSAACRTAPRGRGSLLALPRCVVLELP